LERRRYSSEACEGQRYRRRRERFPLGKET
jgi:hypothetical protein